MTSLRHQLPLLPPGTEVQRLAGGQLGTVQQYGIEHSSGCFPVRWDDAHGTGAVWEICGFNDVLVVRRFISQPMTS